MKKLYVLFLGIAVIISLSSCSVRYDMKGLKKLVYKKPANWQIFVPADDYRYDYVFTFENKGAGFEVYLRTLYVPGKSAAKWLKEEKKASLKGGNKASRPAKFSTKSFKWLMMETEDIIRNGKEKIPVSIRIYAAKEKRSPRLVQCYVVGGKNSFDKLPQGQLNTFIDSISLKNVKIPEKQKETYTNYFTSAEEMRFLLRGKKLVQDKEYSRAISVFNSLLSRQGTEKFRTQLYYLLSASYLERGIPKYIEDNDTRDFQEAINQAKEAVKIDKTYWPAYKNIGIACINMKEQSQAVKYLKKALKYCGKTNPSYPFLQFYLEAARPPLGYKRSLSKIFSRKNKITGFVYDEKEPVVIISGKPYRSGDSVAGHKILKISGESAVMEIAGMLDEFISGDTIPQPKQPEKNK